MLRPSGLSARVRSERIRRLLLTRLAVGVRASGQAQWDADMARFEATLGAPSARVTPLRREG